MCRKIILLVIVALQVFMLEAQTVKPKDRVVVAYITSWKDVMPDPSLVTHINYAFGEVNDSFDGVDIQKPERLRQISALKKKHNKLKVLLSIGGWESGGFSEMASDESKRGSFVNNCADIVNDFNIDGIDIDWEYPSSSAAGIKSSPQDIDNFTSLMRELRIKLSDNKLVTFATVASAQYIDFKSVMPYCDFVNIMAYDMGRPPRHNAPLFPSERSSFSVQQAIDAHIKAGVEPHKLVLGVPLYGHGNKNKGVSDFVDYKNMGKYDKYIHLWDSTACVPYVIDKQNDMIISYDSPESLTLKCNYAVKRGLLGMMYWEYACDDEDLSLVKAVYKAVKAKKQK